MAGVVSGGVEISLRGGCVVVEGRERISQTQRQAKTGGFGGFRPWRAWRLAPDPEPCPTE